MEVKLWGSRMETNVAGPPLGWENVRDYCGTVALLDFSGAPRAIKSEFTCNFFQNAKTWTVFYCQLTVRYCWADILFCQLPAVRLWWNVDGSNFLRELMGCVYFCPSCRSLSLRRTCVSASTYIWCTGLPVYLPAYLLSCEQFTVSSSTRHNTHLNYTVRDHYESSFR